jgi:hypothetical protein
MRVKRKIILILLNQKLPGKALGSLEDATDQSFCGVSLDGNAFVSSTTGDGSRLGRETGSVTGVGVTLTGVPLRRAK